MSDNTTTETEATETAAERYERLDRAHRGQQRIAYRFEKAYAHKLMHVHGVGWHYWDGRRWASDKGDVRTRRSLHTLLRKVWQDALGDKDLAADVRAAQSDGGQRGILSIAATLGFHAAIDDINADPWLLNCANGTFDLHERKLRPHNPKDRITQVCNASYVEGLRSAEEGANWERFLETSLPDDDVRDFLRRYVGQALVGKPLEHALPILTGAGANGKGTFYGAVSYALGDYAMSAEPDLFLHKDGSHPTGEMDLLGKRWVVVSETEKGRRFAEATMKRLTGGDRVRARRMRQDFVEFAPSHSLVLVTNHKPQVSGDDPAIWRRLYVVPFDVVIPPRKRDKHLDEKLAAEADYVLSWAIQGYWDWSRERDLRAPHAVRVATEAYKDESDPIKTFLSEHYVQVSARIRGASIALQDVVASYNDWASRNKAARADGRVMADSLRAFGAEIAKSSGVRVVKGIAER